MSEEAGNQQPAASAGTENTEKPVEHMIPKSRFDQVNEELKAIKTKLTEYEQSQMTEAQRLAAQAAQAQAAAEAAQAELRRARAEAAIAREAARTGVDPALLTKLVHDAVEYDVNGKPTNIDAAVAAALQQWPHLKPAPAAPAVGASNPGRTSKLTMDDVKRMSPDQVNARWDEVQIVLAGG